MYNVQELSDYGVAGARAPESEEQVVLLGVGDGAGLRMLYLCLVRAHLGDAAICQHHPHAEHTLGPVAELVVCSQPVDSAPQQIASHAHTAALAMGVTVF